jgi:signal transduction histidine kinase/ligand-binding sensor domain-containing protein
MWRHLKYFILFTLCANKLFAQLLPFKNYSSKDGLISDRVTSVTRDVKGLLWIGTPFGINWFDGNRFIKPAIPIRSGQLYVTNFFKDDQDNIWVLSFYNGIYQYKDSKFKNFLPDSTIESTANNVFDMLQYDNDRYLVATDQNIFWFDGNSFSLFDKQNPLLAVQFSSIALVKNEWLFFGHPHGMLIYKYENGKWEYSGEVFKEIAINKIFRDQNNTWIATDKGLLFFDHPSKIIKGEADKILFDEIIVYDVTKAAKGELWISADKLYKIKDNTIANYNLSNGLPAIPGKIYVDEEDILWMCSGKGLIKMANQNYVFHDLRNGPAHSMVNGFAYDENNDLWFTTYDGFGQKINNEIRAYRLLNGRHIGYISWFQKTKSYGLLAGSENGILSIKNDQVFLKHKIKTTKIFEDRHGIIWAGTENGMIYKLEKDTLQEVFLQPYLGDYIDAINIDNYGYLWIGYRGSGIRKYEFDKESWKLVKAFSKNTGYKDLRIRCSYADNKGNILFGTRTNGLFIISLADNNKTWHINTSQGLSANWVRSIVADQNDLYLATNQGLNILSGTYDQPMIRKINVLNDELGEQTTTVMPANNKVWIGTEEGIIEYLPQSDKTKMATPRIYITELSINGIRDTLLPVYFSSANKRLPPGKNVIAFEFAGINLYDDAPLQYRYMLEGQDDDWKYSGERNFVSYNLQAGRYTFKAEAKNEFGEWSKQPASFNFIIPMPVWRSWWFISVIAIFILSLLYLFYRYRIQQALKLERLRHRISTDLHDDIGSTLSSISILSEIASKEKDHLQSGNMMKEIKQNSVTLMEKMDDIVWSINPNNDSIENLMLRIKRFASGLFEAKEIDYSIDIDSSIHKAKLNMETRQHIYLIMKEAINNLVKYSNCTNASIRVKYDLGHLLIEIVDNGKGFNEQNIQLGNGIISMKKRAEAIQAQIKIITQLNKGTTISLETKIK